MGKECCTYCFEFCQKTQLIGTWGSSGRLVKIPGCPRCRQRHESEVYKMKADFETKKEYYEAELSKSADHLLTQKKELLSVLTLKSSIEVNQLTADNKKQRNMVEFLRVIQDVIQRDLVLEVPGLIQVSANRAILAARSAVFQKILIQSGTAENPPRVIKVEGISPPVLEEIVQFCYSGEFKFSKLAPPDKVLEVAHTFELDWLKELCDVELCRGVTADNVPEMLKLSRKCSAIKLQEEAWKVFKDNIDTLKDKVFGVLEGPDTTN